MASLISRVVDSLRATRSSRLLTCASPNRDLTTRLHDGQHGVGRHRGARVPPVVRPSGPSAWSVATWRRVLCATRWYTSTDATACDQPAGWSLVTGWLCAQRQADRECCYQ